MPPTGKRPFRFYYAGPNSGPVNMAIDEAVLVGLKQGWSTPILRLYKWDPPAISLGFFQSAGDIDIARCETDRIGVVRRLTGGRAVLHDEEITYSILFSEEDFTPFRKKDIFVFIARCLVDSLKLLGIDSQIAEKTRGSLKSPNCFAAPAQFEIESAEKGKLIGSAQVISDGVVLQHGAIPLTASYRKISKYLRGDDTSFKSASHLSHMAGADRSEGCEHDLIECIRKGFGVNLPMNDGELNEREWRMTRKLTERKYAKREWLLRR